VAARAVDARGAGAAWPDRAAGRRWRRDERDRDPDWGVQAEVIAWKKKIGCSPLLGGGRFRLAVQWLAGYGVSLAPVARSKTVTISRE
jgi:hypothetical protein